MTCDVVPLTTPFNAQQCVRWLRRRQRLSQAHVADAVGRSQQWLSRLENGLAEPSLEDLIAVLAVLGAHISLRPSEPPPGDTAPET